jgi:hypothetical protein
MTQVLVPPGEIEDSPSTWGDDPRWAAIVRQIESPITTQAPPPAPVRTPLFSAATPSAGWYPDPHRLRFWDGSEWTNETRPLGTPAPVAGRVAGRLAAPVVVVDEPGARPEAAKAGHLAHELVKLLLVLGVALAAGALVAAIGIVFTV